jgi:signal transduction histidine kinase/ActR/RegA family two-component response regulator
MYNRVDEIRRLQRCVNDLISVLALPALWGGSESAQIVGTLLDVLVAMLRLDLAYARLSAPNYGSPMEVVRSAHRQHPSVQPQQVGQALGCWLTGDQAASRFVVPNPAGEGEISIASFSLGIEDQVGVLVAGSRRSDFPTDIERLLLQVAANQAVIGLQQARRSSEHKRLAEALEQRVTERTRQLTAINAELRRSEAYLAEAQRLSHTGSFGWRVSTGEILWSDETFRIFEYERTTKPTIELVVERVHPEDAAVVKQTIECASQDGKDFAHEYRLRMPDGRVKHVEEVAHSSEGESGNLEFVGAVMDITERKLAEAERARLGERLRQAEKMEAIGRLAGGIAHDFNNVLSGILAYGEMLFEEAPASSSRQRYAQNVLTAATRGRALVEQILAYSRSQRGKRAPADVCRIVTETLELVRGSLPANVLLDSSAQKLPLVVIGDATQLHQVVMNLCSNAIHAMSAGGTLGVALTPLELVAERVLSHGTLRPGHYVRLTIKDTGCGMGETTLARIFEPFFTTKEVGRGTGLGLSLVDAIVTDLAGAIDVKSALEKGSTFEIYLPLVELALADATGADGPLPRGSGERVLIVDDEEPFVALTSEVLSRLGYEPVSFSDSQAALAAFEAAPGQFDVVVTDALMPGITGTTLASMVRRRRPDLPIVLVSAYSGSILRQQALAAGVSELLTKPLQSREIATTLARVLHRASETKTVLTPQRRDAS